MYEIKKSDRYNINVHKCNKVSNCQSTCFHLYNATSPCKEHHFGSLRVTCKTSFTASFKLHSKHQLSLRLSGQRMKEAWELDQFHRAVEDELVWVKEADTLLGNEDIGKDLQGVRFLLKNHQVS